MKDITVQLNGVKLESEHGKTVLEVAAANGVKIPTLCHVEGLGPYGGCRVCLVEVTNWGRAHARPHGTVAERPGELANAAEMSDVSAVVDLPVESTGLAAACVTNVADGMRVETSSPRVLRARRFVVEMLLSDHRKDCIACDKWGSCQLKQLADELGLAGRRSVKSAPQIPSTFPNIAPPLRGEGTPGPKGSRRHSSVSKRPDREGADPPGMRPYGQAPIVKDVDACILCGRCVRICREERKVSALCFEGKGSETSVVTPFSGRITETPCVLCGRCVAACPAGALQRTSAFDEWRAVKKKT